MTKDLRLRGSWRSLKALPPILSCFSDSMLGHWSQDPRSAMLDSVGKLVEEARAFNERLQAVCFINRADAIGWDNTEAASIAKGIPGLTYLGVGYYEWRIY